MDACTRKGKVIKMKKQDEMKKKFIIDTIKFAIFVMVLLNPAILILRNIITPYEDVRIADIIKINQQGEEVVVYDEVEIIRFHKDSLEFIDNGVEVATKDTSGLIVRIKSTERLPHK